MVIIYDYMVIRMSNRSAVSVSNFKAHCLEYIENVSNQHYEYIVTKRNKPVAKLIPLEETNFQFGQLKGTAVIKGDIVSPIDIDWEAAQ